MTGRLILAILSTLLEETALVVIALFGLPRIGINIPLAGLISLMVVWGAASIIIYQAGSRALRRKPVVGLPTMIDSKGKVVSPLAPIGAVRIKGETWEATSTGGEWINTGEEVIVVEQDGLKLIVCKSSKKTS